MSRLAQQAELLKLARLLDVDAAALRMLAPAAAADVRLLREQATRASFASDEAFFKRVVAASRLLPVAVLAMVAERVLGPLLSARVAGQMDVKRGVGIASRLPAPFLADVCLSLDPQHTRELVAAIPVDLIVPVALELARRDEHVTMGRFVDILDEPAIRAVIAALQDNAHLLRIAFFAENKPRLDGIVGMLDESRLTALIRTASSDADLWPEALGLMQHLSPPVRGRLGDLAAGLDDGVLTSMATSVRAHDLWGDALPVLASMSEPAQARFACLPAVQDEAMLADILSAAGRYGVWPQLLPLVRLMDAEGKVRCARVAGRLDGEQLLAIAEVAAEYGLWPEMIELVALMDEAQRLDTMALLGIAPLRVVESLVPALEQVSRWELVNASWARMSHGARERLHAAAQAQGLGERIRPLAPGAAVTAVSGGPDLAPLQALLEQQQQATAEVTERCLATLDAWGERLQRQTAAMAELAEQNQRLEASLQALRSTLGTVAAVAGVALLVLTAAGVLVALRLGGAA